MAAKQSGESYGTFASRLTPEQRADILEAYREMMKERREEEKARLKRAAERKQKADPLWDMV